MRSKHEQGILLRMIARHYAAATPWQMLAMAHRHRVIRCRVPAAMYKRAVLVGLTMRESQTRFHLDIRLRIQGPLAHEST